MQFAAQIIVQAILPSRVVKGFDLQGFNISKNFRKRAHKEVNAIGTLPQYVNNNIKQIESPQ